MKIIDMHAHVFPDAIAPAAIKALEGKEGVEAFYDGTLDGLTAAMDRAGISRSLVAPVALKPSQVSSINDWITGLPQERIIPFGAMHPDFAEPAAELARLADRGVRGFKLHSQNQDFSPDDPKMAPVYEAAIEAGMIILFHAGGFVVDEGVTARPEAFARMLDAYPGLICILAHMGSYLYWDEVREHLCGRDVYLDTAYTPGHLPDDALLALMRDHGIEKILFGSDGPWTDASAEIAHLRAMGLTDTEQQALFAGNAEHLLGLR